jgi:hypothetical protein
MDSNNNRRPCNLLQRDEARAHAVVHVVCVVGNFVGQVAQLRLERGRRTRQKPLPHPTRLGQFQSLGMGTGAVFEDAFAGFKTQVQAIERGVALLQHIHHPQALQVVLEASVALHARMQGILARMAKRGVAQVVRQRNGLHQVFAQPEAAGNAAPQLRHLQAVRQSGAEQVSLVVQKHLGFVHQPPKRGAVHDAVAVTLKVAAGGCGYLCEAAATGVAGVAGQWVEGMVHAATASPQ